MNKTAWIIAFSFLFLLKWDTEDRETRDGLILKYTHKYEAEIPDLQQAEDFVRTSPSNAFNFKLYEKKPDGTLSFVKDMSSRSKQAKKAAPSKKTQKKNAKTSR